jgi:hypothetical protein
MPWVLLCLHTAQAWCVIASLTDKIDGCMHVHRKTSLDVGSPAGEDEEVEGLLHNKEGCVIFTGGHYSAGPDYIGGCVGQPGVLVAYNGAHMCIVDMKLVRVHCHSCNTPYSVHYGRSIVGSSIQ